MGRSMSKNTVVTAVCGVVAAAGLVATGAALANASSRSATPAVGSYSAAPGAESSPQTRGGQHTAVTGTELDKVKAAVKRKDSSVTVTSVRKDADGSYDVFGTKAGAPVRLEVSKDLATITTEAGRGDHGGHGGPGGPAGSADTPVTGTELTTVTAAVKAKDSTVTVTSVRKDADGSYDVFGTKAGAPVRLEVSKDLRTFTTRPGGGPGGPGGAGWHGGPDGPDGPQSAAPRA
jgi:hypothetical protein